MTRIWHISDTHSFHDQIIPPDLTTIDLIIHSGDFAQYRDPARNESECLSFLEWFAQFPAPKVLIAGNHDTAVEARMVTRDQIEDITGCVYLEHESAIVNGIKIFGSPFTPLFGNWAFTKKPNSLFAAWEMIDEDTDLLVTHGPGKGEFDVCEDMYKPSKVVHVGCKNLLNRMHALPQLKAHLFGHIHNDSDQTFVNNTWGRIYGLPWISSNASSVNDGRTYGKEIRNGNVVEIPSLLPSKKTFSMDVEIPS